MSTIKDVARLARVGVGTVSRVINKSGSVDPATAEKVWSAIRDLQYVPNANARSLVTRKSYLLGVVLPDLTNPFFPAVVRGIETFAARLGYMVIVVETDWNIDQERAAVYKLRQQAVDGLILVSSVNPEELIQDSALGTLPFIIADRGLSGHEITQITVDHYAGAIEAMNHLVERGHKNIGFIAGRDSESATQRRRAYERVMTDLGLSSRVWQGPEGYTFKAGYEGMAELYGKVSAVFAANDLSALGALMYLQERRVRVPQEVAIMGFDDILPAVLVHPRLTTVHQPADILGTESARLVIEKIDAMQEGSEIKVSSRILTPHLVVREST
ncbi:MAG: LacI family DNA-binding transcriptional regulator [Sulfobacillus thermotolerans]|nr:LacI family DNA-binding transcriptional regulator [Sulfobacillus thermotolerans]